MAFINSYLTDRKQCVALKNIRSDDLTTDTGVPQGSILGPLLFLIYINDIVQSSNILKFVMFADDTCLFLSHQKSEILQEILLRELPKVCDWLTANKLSLNVKKTNLIVFKNKKAPLNNEINIQINGQKIEQVTSAKYLGIIIDHKLSFKHHIDHIAQKITKGNTLIARLRHFVNREVLLNFYRAHLQSYLNYCTTSWAATAKSYIDRISKLQIKSLKLITFEKLMKVIVINYLKNVGYFY